jgi:hypothetical protein
MDLVVRRARPSDKRDGGRARPLADLLRGLRARRRGLDDVSFYASTADERHAARSAGFERPWSGETYLYEKRFARRGP